MCRNLYPLIKVVVVLREGKIIEQIETGQKTLLQPV